MAQAIYEQHDKHFANVSAYVVIDPAAPANPMTVALHYPRDGAGRLYAYVHVRGLPMVRAFASGGGYDKASAAVQSAVERIELDASGDGYMKPYNDQAERLKAVQLDNGHEWASALAHAGYVVLKAV